MRPRISALLVALLFAGVASFSFDVQAGESTPKSAVWRLPYIGVSSRRLTRNCDGTGAFRDHASDPGRPGCVEHHRMRWRSRDERPRGVRHRESMQGQSHSIDYATLGRPELHFAQRTRL